MTLLSVTPLYAALLTVIFMVLSARVVIERRTNKIAYGDNDSPRVHAKIRAQAHFAEYVPLALILMALAEINGIGAVWLHLGGVVLLIGRLLHGYGMSFDPKWFRGRVWGMMLTVTALPYLAVLALLSIL